MNIPWRKAIPNMWRAICLCSREFARALVYAGASENEAHWTYQRAMGAIESLGQGETVNLFGESYLARLDATSPDIVAKALQDCGYTEADLALWRHGHPKENSMKIDDDSRHPLNWTYAVVGAICLAVLAWTVPQTYAAWTDDSASATLRFVWGVVSLAGLVTLYTIGCLWLATTAPRANLAGCQVALRRWWDWHGWSAISCATGLAFAGAAWLADTLLDPAALLQHVGDSGYYAYTAAWWILAGASAYLIFGPALMGTADKLIGGLTGYLDPPPIDPAELDRVLQEEWTAR